MMKLHKVTSGGAARPLQMALHFLLRGSLAVDAQSRLRAARSRLFLWFGPSTDRLPPIFK